jgi:FixJ family two-component response regulator
MDPLPDPKLISIIDDDESVRRATRSLVRSLGFEAQTFASAEDFLQSALLDATACIVCDVQMPGMSGIDLYDALKGQGRPIAMIFITAFSQELVRERAGDTACILLKPFEASEFADCLERSIRAA